MSDLCEYAVGIRCESQTLDSYEKLYERAREPKKFVVFPITHYEIYAVEWLEMSSGLACDWLTRYLM